MATAQSAAKYGLSWTFRAIEGERNGLDNLDMDSSIRLCNREDLMKGKTAGISQAIHYRNYRRARDRALARLAKEYPEQYQEYLQEEKASDETTGKKWLSTGVTVGVSTGIESYKDAVESSLDPDNEGENPSYYGGEEE